MIYLGMRIWLLSQDSGFETIVFHELKFKSGKFHLISKIKNAWLHWWQFYTEYFLLNILYT
jgi:hypothetical protein